MVACALMHARGAVHSFFLMLVSTCASSVYLFMMLGLNYAGITNMHLSLYMHLTTDDVTRV